MLLHVEVTADIDMDSMKYKVSLIFCSAYIYVIIGDNQNEICIFLLHEIKFIALSLQKKPLNFRFITYTLKNVKVSKKAKIRNQYNQVPHLTQDTIWESDKIHENITYKRAKRLDLS